MVWSGPGGNSFRMSVDPIVAALSGACSFAGLTLPDPLPASPIPLFMEWMGLAATSKTQPNPNAMTLATVDEAGHPSARIVLARRVDAARGYVVFFTNYEGAKGRELIARPEAALCFHWDHLDRQVRISGPVTRSPQSESDDYFRSRPVMSRIAAWASDQSRPLASRAELIEKNAAAERRFGLDPATPRDEQGRPAKEIEAGLNVPRPPHWGGFRVWARRVELWLGHPARLHDRAAWTRTLTPATVDGAAGYEGGEWSGGRLQP